MYHIKDDKRSKNSAKLIYKGLRECLESCSLENTTITDICKKCSVSRATFYRIFDNVEDVLQYQVDMALQNVDKMVIGSNPKDFYNIIVSLCYENAELFQIIFHSNRYDMLFNTYSQFSLKYEDAIQYRSYETQAQIHFDFSILTGILVGTLSNWVKYGQKESIEELCKYIEHTISYLYNLSNTKKASTNEQNKNPD